MSLPIHSVRIAALLAVGGIMTLARADEPKPVPLNQALFKQVPAIIDYLKKHDIKNVGVLKFRVKIGDAKATDSAGPINLAVANQLEIALMLCRTNDPKNPIGIIGRASEVAASIRGASHLTKEGRPKLFTKTYPLAWGQESVTPDAFLTGVVEVAADLKEMKVHILAFGKDGAKLDPVVDFTAACKPTTLSESGESFLVRGFADDGKVVVNTTGVKTGKVEHPWKDKEAPIQLDIRYNGKSVPVVVKDGRAWVAEPKEGDKVSFLLRRNDGSKERYGVVLMVNGENTLYKQRLSPELCTKWIFDPGAGPYTVEGYKTGVDRGEAFRVLSRAESKENEVHYGADVGTIGLAVFREKRVKEPPKLVNFDEEDMAAIHRGIFPEKDKPRTLAALRQQLRDDLGRGLIAAGEEIGIQTVKVKFDTDPTPVMAVTVTYYKP